MSYLKSIDKAKEYTEKPHKLLEAGGGLDILVGSPAPGNASEPWFVMLKKSQLKTTEAKAFISWLKSCKVPGEDTMWSHTFDGMGKWHQIDNRGNVRAPCCCAFCAHTLAPPRPQPDVLLFPRCVRAAERVEARRLPRVPGHG